MKHLFTYLFAMVSVHSWMTTASAADAGTSQIIIGHARFTVITPQCIRLEYNSAGKFIDEPSYFAINRDRRFEGAKIQATGNDALIDTGLLLLTYHGDGHEFSEQNLQIEVRDGESKTTWHPGLANKDNLGGTERTLDGWDGPRQLSGGLIARDGWHVIEDSASALRDKAWFKARPNDAGTDWYFFGYGHDYKAALQSLTAIGGDVPLPRRYALGVWYSRYWPYTSDEFRAIVKEYAQHEFPLDVLVMDMDWHLDGWTGYTWNPKLLPDHAELLKWLHDQKLAVTLNDHPAQGVQPHEQCYPAFMQSMGKSPGDPPIPFDAGNKNYLDTFYQYTHHPLEKEGVDFFWLDWQQYPNALSLPQLTNLQVLNDYNFRETEREDHRGIGLSRWGGWGGHRFPIQFSGDASTSFKMLAAEVPFTSAAGNVGCFFWSHDIGGHNRGRNEESYARWCQFGALSAALRSHSTRDPSMDRRPWTYPKWAEDSMRVSFQLRSKLFPYIYSAVQQACATSLPLIRPMYLDYPTTEAAYQQPQQYLLGDNVLVTPITEAGAGPNRLGRQTVWFPPGRWFNYFTGEQFEGPSQKLVAADINEFPLYFRGGVPIAMGPFRQRMASDPLSALTIRCYPGADGKTQSSELYEDDGRTTEYRNGRFGKTRLTATRHGSDYEIRIDPTAGDYNGQLEARAYEIELPGLKQAPHATVNDTSAAVTYDAAQSLNRIVIPSTSIRTPIVVRVHAEEEDPQTAFATAFARRSGIDAKPDELIEAMLPVALEHAQDDAHKAAICAAAGVGIFPWNQHVYGFPATATDQVFASDSIKADVTPVAADADDSSQTTRSRYTVKIGSHSFISNGTESPVDFSKLPRNIAAAAKITTSSGDPAGLVDGHVDGYPNAQTFEWVTDAEKSGAWAKFEWPQRQTVERVVLFDRPNPDDYVVKGRIEFSDGSSIDFDALKNDAASGTTVKFPPKTIQWLKIAVSEAGPKTRNIGLSEVVIAGQ